MKWHRRKSSYDKFSPQRKSSWIRITVAVGVVVLVAIAAITVFLVYRHFHGVEGRTDYEKVSGSSTIPIVTVIFGSDQINQLYGYTEEMDVRSMRDTICVLEETYSLVITANTEGEKIKGVSFRLYDLSGKSLVQSSDAYSVSYNEDSGFLVSELRFDNIISENTEYNLVIDLKDSHGNDIYYYTRIIRDAATSVEAQIDFIEYFHNAVYSLSERDEEIIRSYLETDYRYEDNTDLCHVYLLSNYYHVTWGDMVVEEVIAPVVNLIDVNGNVGCYRLDYVVARDLSTETPEYILVSEFYRVRTVEDENYLLAYDRTAETIFMPSENTIGTKSADLGIVSADRKIEVKNSPDGNFTGFVGGGSLWMWDAEENMIRCIFSFMSNVNEISDIREINNEHDIRIIQVTDEGDIEFMVYGYMNKGTHEGACGLAVYMYNAKDDRVNEEVFMQSDLPYQVMSNTFEDVCYLSNNGNLYVCLDETVYAINISTSEAEVVAQSVVNGSYKVSTGGRWLAWQKDAKVNDADEIYILDMETEELYTVTAETGKSIKVLGFLGENFVYGSGDNENYYSPQVGTELLLMDEVFVVNENGTQTHDEAAEGIYYVSAEDEYNRVVVNCVNSMNDYAEASNLTIYAAESDTAEDASSYTEYLDIRETVHYVEFATRTSSVLDASIDKSTPIYMSDSDISSLGDLLSVSGKYYVYASGGLAGILTDASESIQLAYDGGGVVTYEGNYFYRRGLRASSSEVSEENISKAITAYEENTGLDVTGITLEEAMYFLGIKTPLIWEYNEKTYIIYGYTLADDLMLYEIETGETATIEYYDVYDIFSESGYCYIVQ